MEADFLVHGCTERGWTLADVRDFADSAHRAVGQVRKYTGEPYIVHRLGVAGLVSTALDCTKEMLAAALLHDVHDDAGIALDEIRARFGANVARYVGQLSNASSPADGNRVIRAEIELRHVARADARVQTIKLADIIHNTSSIVALDAQFAGIYLPEKTRQIEVLTQGDAGLRHMAAETIQRGLARLAEIQTTQS